MLSHACMGPWRSKNHEISWFLPEMFFFLKKFKIWIQNHEKMSKNIFLSFFLWVFKKCWKIIFLWFFRLKRHKNVFGRPVSSTWVVLVRCGPLWRTGNVDIFAFKIESKYVSRSVTKVFVGILCDFEVPVWWNYVLGLQIANNTLGLSKWPGILWWQSHKHIFTSSRNKESRFSVRHAKLSIKTLSTSHACYLD